MGKEPEFKSKICIKCKKRKPLFSFRRLMNGVYCAKCKECKKKWRKGKETRTKKREERMKRQEEFRAKRQFQHADTVLTAEIKRLKLKTGCYICGYKRYVGALAFHHIGKKRFDIGKFKQARGKHYKVDEQANKVVYEEIQRCIVVCANCHREIHGGRITLNIQG